jgi:hypothetical protein
MPAEISLLLLRRLNSGGVRLRINCVLGRSRSQMAWTINLWTARETATAPPIGRPLRWGAFHTLIEPEREWQRLQLRLPGSSSFPHCGHFTEVQRTKM